MKTILITGGSGFIGSHLSETLLGQGNRIICVDNFLTSSKKNVEHLLDNENFVLVEHDIIDVLDIDEHIDQIYNLACPASPIHYQKDAIKTIQTNTMGMIHILELAKKHGATVLQASTSEVYGDPEVHPQPEEYRGNVNTIGPRACYDEGKRCAETLCFDYHRSHGVDIKVVRIFNTYGPRMAEDDGRVVSNFILQALNNQNITIYGDGAQTRSFCFVNDLVRGLVAMMNSDKDVTGPINLGNPREFTIKELAEKVITLTDSQSTLIFEDLPEDDPKKRKPDVTKAKNILDWEPRIILDEGLKKTITYFKK